MVDLETFGTTNNAIITAIGACFFDPTTATIGQEFYVNVDANDGLRRGFQLDINTLYWWCKQSAQAGEALSNPTPVPVDTALYQFAAFIQENRQKHLAVWSHATFDAVVLTNAYNRVNIKLPFHYRDAKDIRTLHYLIGDVDVGEFEGARHNALADARHQAKYVSAMLQKF